MYSHLNCEFYYCLISSFSSIGTEFLSLYLVSISQNPMRNIVTLRFFYVWGEKVISISWVAKERGCKNKEQKIFNPLNPELNPICYLLALLGAHHFLHVSRIRVKLLTFRLLMSYIYIYIWSTHS